jgi:hypothetical protein
VSYIIGLSDATNKKREEKKLLQERRIDVWIKPVHQTKQQIL